MTTIDVSKPHVSRHESRQVLKYEHILAVFVYPLANRLEADQWPKKFTVGRRSDVTRI